MMKVYRPIDLIFKNKVYRRLILVFGDLFVIPISIIISLYLKYDSFQYIFFEYNWLFVFLICFSLPVYIFLGQYKSLSSYFGIRILIRSFSRNIVICLFTYIVGLLLSLTNPSISLWILIVFNITFFNLIFRYTIRKILISYSKNNKNFKNY